MKLLLGEMLDPSIAAELRARGHDVVAVAERPDLRLRRQPDRAILAAAEAEDRIVVTEDRDYRRLGAERVLADRSYPALIFTDDRSWPRANRRTLGRLVTALDQLLTSGVTLEGEHWLAPPD